MFKRIFQQGIALVKIIFAASFFLPLLICSCHSNNGTKEEARVADISSTGDTTQTTSDSSAEKKFVSDELTTLYLKNTKDSPQLYQLIGRGVEKISLQFYIDASGSFGLYAYPALVVDATVFRGNANRGRFLVQNKKKLTDSKVVAERYNNREVILSSLQVADEAFDSLYNIKVSPQDENRTGYEYIWFVPAIKPDPENNNLNAVFYMLKHDSKPPSLIEKLAGEPFGKTEANPSPPRKPR